MVLIFKFYTVPVRLRNVKKNFKQENSFKQTGISFLPRKYDVISQLRHSYAKGPLCVTRLKCVLRTFYKSQKLLKRGTCKLRNGKKRKETKRNGKKKKRKENKEKSNKKKRKKNETQKNENKIVRKETKQKKKKRNEKNVKKRNEMKSTEARR